MLCFRQANNCLIVPIENLHMYNMVTNEKILLKCERKEKSISQATFQGRFYCATLTTLTSAINMTSYLVAGLYSNNKGTHCLA